MSNSQPPTEPPTTYPPSPGPQPGVTKHWPLDKANITLGSPFSPVDGHKHSRVVIPVTVSLGLVPGLELNEAPTLSLLYVVNGSLDYSHLFSQVDVNNNSAVTLEQDTSGTWVGSVTLPTLPLAPNTTFALEVVAYPACAETVISVPPSAADPQAEDKSLKALNALATTALVTALGALAFALLRSKD